MYLYTRRNKNFFMGVVYTGFTYRFE